MILVTQSVEPVRASYTISLRILFKSNCPRWDRVIRISLLGGLMVALLPDMLNGSFWTISDWESLRAMLLRNGLIAILALVSVPLVVLFEALVMTLWLHHRLRPDQLRAWAEISPMGITLSTEDNDSSLVPGPPFAVSFNQRPITDLKPPTACG